MNIEISPKEYEKELNWDDSNLYCQLLDIDGKKDWRMDDQREAMKDIFEAIKEDFQIAPKYSRKLSKTYYKNNFHESQAEHQEFESLYELIIGDDN
jgi:hypothetical protein